MVSNTISAKLSLRSRCSPIRSAANMDPIAETGTARLIASRPLLLAELAFGFNFTYLVAHEVAPLVLSETGLESMPRIPLRCLLKTLFGQNTSCGVMGNSRRRAGLSCVNGWPWSKIWPISAIGKATGPATAANARTCLTCADLLWCRTYTLSATPTARTKRRRLLDRCSSSSLTARA
jgi:hypothetical protein